MASLNVTMEFVLKKVNQCKIHWKFNWISAGADHSNTALYFN